MNGNEFDHGPIWEDADRHRRAAAMLMWIAGLSIAAIVVVALATILMVESQVEASARDDALALAAAISVAPRDVIPGLVEASGSNAMIVEESVTIETFGAGEALDPDFARWQTRVRNKAYATGERTFTSEAPNGQEWWHSALHFRDGEMLIVNTPRALGMQLARTIEQIILLASLAAIAIVVALTVVAYRRVVIPAKALVAANEDLRVRGELRAPTRQRLESVGQIPTEFHELAVAVQHLERESMQGHRQVDALLAAAGALGGSLDQSAILNSTLEHLELLLGAERSAIMRYDVHATSYEVVAMHGHTDDWLDDMNVAHTDQFAPTMRAIRERAPVQVSDTESEVVSTSLRERGRRHGYRSVLAIPLTDDLERPTVLVMHSANTKTYSFDEIELSKSFASIAGAALRNAELFERTDADLQQQTSRLESIVESVEQGLIVEGSNGVVVYANGEIRQLLPPDIRHTAGRRSDEVVASILHRGNAAPSAGADLADLPAGANQWADIELIEGETVRTFRVRKFVVRNAHGAAIGRGQTWTDVTRDRELERMKSGLLAAVSHEFRTPLALIKGYATTLLADDVEWEQHDQRKFLSLVSSEADRLADLVQRILDMRRIDAGMVSLQLMPVQLDVLIDAVRDSLPLENDRIIVDELPAITLNVDAARIVTALRNLVENACKYSPPDQPVTVSAEVGDGHLELVVRDRGPGVDPAIRDRLFDTFVRGETGLAALHGGVGLGLALSRGFVEAHDGRLYVAETSEGHGAEFRLQLPLAHARKRVELAR